MINPSTGTIKLPAKTIVVSGQLTREQFLSSTLANQSQVLVRNEPHCSFKLPSVSFDGHFFAWNLWFHGSTLQRVSIACADSQFGSSWSDWSEDKEQARKQFHDHLINSTFGERLGNGHFPWGSVESIYDERSGGSSVEVIYCSRSA
jgi:hypothetical protein